jgi:hypothetical protein
VARAPPSASPLLLFVAGTTTVMSTAAASDSSCVATVVLCECNDWDCAPCHILCDFVRLCLLFGVFLFFFFFKDVRALFKKVTTRLLATYSSFAAACGTCNVFFHLCENMNYQFISSLFVRVCRRSYVDA